MDRLIFLVRKYLDWAEQCRMFRFPLASSFGVAGRGREAFLERRKISSRSKKSIDEGRPKRPADSLFPLHEGGSELFEIYIVRLIGTPNQEIQKWVLS